MRALDPRLIDAVFAAVEGLLPPRPVDDHPLGCHRPRIDDRTCCTGIVYRLALGCSWVDAARLVGVGQATLRRRRDEWVAGGVFDALVEEAIAGYDRITMEAFLARPLPGGYKPAISQSSRSVNWSSTNTRSEQHGTTVGRTDPSAVAGRRVDGE